MKPSIRPRRALRALGVLAVPGAALALASGAVAQVTTTTPIPPPPPPPQVDDLQIHKTAEIHYTRENHWSIEKSASTKAGYDAKNNSVAVDYAVKVDKQWKATDVVVRGYIGIANPNKFAVPALLIDAIPHAYCRIVENGEGNGDNGDVTARMAAQPEGAMEGAEGLDEHTRSLPEGAIIEKGILGPGERVTLPYVCHMKYTPKKGVENTAKVIWPKYVPRPPDPEVSVVAEATAEALMPPRRIIGVATATAYAKMADASYDEVDPYVRVTDTMEYGKTRVLHPKLGHSKTFTYTRYLSAWKGKCRVWHNYARAWAPRIEDEIPVEAVELQRTRGNDYVEEEPNGLDRRMVAKDDAWVKICPPPPPTKGEPAQPPVVVVDTGDKPKPADVTPSKNPKGEVIVPKAKPSGALKVHKRVAGRRAVRNGSVVKWRIMVRNTGKTDLNRVRVVDLLPRQLRVVSDEKVRRAGKVLIFQGDLAVGQRKVFTVYTRVVGRPVMNRRTRALARNMNARQRRAAIMRIRRGVVCNTVVALADNARPDRGRACLRVLKPRPPAEVELPKTEEEDPGVA